MTSLSESNPPSLDSALGSNNRWLFNANGQLVDVNPDAGAASWDLADEIVRLNIGDVAGEIGRRCTHSDASKVQITQHDRAVDGNKSAGDLFL